MSIGLFYNTISFLNSKLTQPMYKWAHGYKQIMFFQRKRKFHTTSPNRRDSDQKFMKSDRRERRKSSSRERSRDNRKQRATTKSSSKPVAVSQKPEVTARSPERVKLKKMKVICMYEDEGEHWCKLCNLVSDTLAQHLIHLRCAAHVQVHPVLIFVELNSARFV